MNTALLTLSSGSPGQFHWRGQSARSWNVALILHLIFFLALTFGGVSPTSSDDTPESFTAALRAQDFGDWGKSIELLERALTKRPEDGKPLLFYGKRFKNYLPHYYLGLALFNQGDCAGATREWDLSLRIGAIKGAEIEYKELLRLRDKCVSRPH